MTDVRAICRLLDRLDESAVELDRSSTRTAIDIGLARADIPYLKELVTRDLQQKMKRAGQER
jgi:uncharacterized protein YjiS (DUF1127 family)